MIRTSRSSYRVGALTHPGMTGKNNEDRYAVSAYRLKPRSRAPVLFGVLCDGIGGHRAGEIAAEIAVEQISRVVAASDGSVPLATMAQAVVSASLEINRRSAGYPELQGMGSTCACAWIIAGRLYTTTVGDSRIYILRGNTITQLSTDHTWVQEAIEQGSLTPETARGHPNSHVIRRYLGSPVPPEADFRLRLPGASAQAGAEANQGLILKEGDRVMLCSDGLTDLVEDAEILAAYREDTLDGANRRLVDLANRRGGHDNITIVAIELPRRTALERLASSNRLFRFAMVMTLLLALVVFAGLVIGFDWLNNRAGEVQATPTALMAAPTQALPVTIETQLQPSTLTPSPTLGATVTPAPAGTSGPPGTQPASSAPTATPWPTNTLQP